MIAITRFLRILDLLRCHHEHQMYKLLGLVIVRTLLRGHRHFTPPRRGPDVICNHQSNVILFMKRVMLVFGMWPKTGAILDTTAKQNDEATW
jgi:hypothetical protein